MLLRDIRSGRDPAVAAVIEGLAAIRPDVVLLTRVDHDLNAIALTALTARLRQAGLDYPHRLAPAQNRGLRSGIDLDGNGRSHDPEDAQGYGRFSGDGAMALLSRYPLGPLRDFSTFLWRDLPGARLSGLPAAAQPVQRLSSAAHWDLTLTSPAGPLHLLAWAATPPLFGAGQRNAERNHDEAAFWLHLLDGRLDWPPPPGPVVLIGSANLAPGQGHPAALAALATHPALQPPLPLASADLRQGAAPLGHLQAGLGVRVLDSGLWPARPAPATATGGHRLLWMDVELAARP